MHVLDQLMNCVVRIEAKPSQGKIVTGTGFACRFSEGINGIHVPTIVTNKHVIEDVDTVTLPISVLDETDKPTGRFYLITLQITQDNVLYHPDDEVDLCAILSAPIHQYFQHKNEKSALVHVNKSVLATTSTFADLLPLEEVMMIGFPNGIWDFTNNGAIARKGVIATMPCDDYLGKKQFVMGVCYF